MSQRPNEPPARSSMPPNNGRLRDRPDGHYSPLLRSDGGSSRQSTPHVNEARASGELEGSTLGSSSREGERRKPGQRRTQSPSGFLVDSLPRSKGTRVSLHRPRPSEPPAERRSVPESDIVVPKKRSRFPWSRHKNHEAETVAVDSVPTPANAGQASNPVREPSGGSSQPETQRSSTDQSTPGLDRDSIQIVNLALNLNESRRRTASGIPPGTGGRRPISVSQPAMPQGDSYAQSPNSRNFHRDSAFRNYTQLPGDRLSQGTLPSVEQSSVVNLLPSSAVDDHRAYEFSESTLARAERARTHFDLFHEYVRLLPLLPPLREAKRDSPTESSKSGQLHRGYNPLQMIRNRKVRYREKCSIDADAEGWHDVERVHQWISNVEQKYSSRQHDQLESLRLPPFQQGHRHVQHGDQDDIDMMTTSPPSSLRRVSRTSSMKARRPRIDWKISPAELLADAAWLEEGTNKTKVVDKDGYKLYPDSMHLKITNSHADNTAHNIRSSVDVEVPGDRHSSRRTSMSSAHPALAHEFKSVGRGRHRHRFRSHSHSLRSRSASSSRKPSRWNKVKLRSGSVSSSSSTDSTHSIDEKPRMSREHLREHVHKLVDKSTRNLSSTRASRAKSPAVQPAEIDRGRTPQPSEPLSLNTGQGKKHRRGSLSSTGSFDNGADPRMSLEGMDSTAPNSPVHAGYFPSIAVNLSPPSSRSPSPAKKGLRHKIVSRHERSKSKQRDLHEDEFLESEASRQHSVTSPERTEAPKLEPSPFPDVVSSSYTADQGTSEGSKADGHKSRKGAHLPESKLRGIFKGPGRIAELVGNEVSKVGDLILKKDADPDSRKSSSATTFVSDDSDSDDENKLDKKSSSKRLLERLPTFTEDSGRLPRKESEKAASRSFIPSLPSFTSPLRQNERIQAPEAIDFGNPQERVSPRKRDTNESSKNFALPRSKTLDFAPSLHTERVKHAIKGPSVPFSLARPPVTGLANARASPGLSPDGRCAGLSGSSRAWSISGRSLRTSNDTGVPGKPEVERTQALLLSSGIKAREITRRAHENRETAPHWLQASLGPTALSSTSNPRVTRIEEFDIAAQNLLQRFEKTQYSFQQSMHHFSTTTSSPLREQLKSLEDLVKQSLTPRVRSTANDAEDMCVQLNTTSTLAVKQLSDALDMGIRKRRRRLRWIRRTGFMVLEWALVAMLWWVWLIVMAFKLVRGVFRGAFSGVRWVLWL
ncbi:hypothetical protein PENANT_c020G08354 [Penicillium antarcticum]|uniref:Uncharacterized protein n=1 Tax=Penicillium antarcticum TaxID=416450 RepID=A0A1V6Q1N0_9EURO|nr:uncharacterized protein N7508_004359 [Penicillium antarcticum]KAJ5308980.1 hypothetical protein N7508_004359 [Penicillium antarcticum]OQD82626.1 hypothetical protein PENANT_c020G08354 [Penicillium antarcticum]